MSTPESPNPNKERFKPNAVEKAAMYVVRLGMEASLAAMFGRKHTPSIVSGLCEDAIIAPRLCSPADGQEYLKYEQAHAGHSFSYDFRRPEFFPLSKDKRWMKLEREGTIFAYMLDGIESRPEDERTHLPIGELLTLDTLMTFDKPGIEKLREIGMIARRSHEQAYEIAGQEQWIDELRSRGVADDPVHQVTPKGHSLIYLTKESGKKTPKKEAQLQLSRLPGILAH